VVALPRVYRQQRRQPGTGGQPALRGYRVDVQVDGRPVLRGVGAHLGGGHAQSGTAQRVQRVPVDDALLDGGQVGGAGQERAQPVRLRLGGAGQGEVGDAVVQLGGEPVAVRAGSQRADEAAGVGVPADGEARRGGRERLGGRRGSGDDAPVDQHEDQLVASGTAGDDARDRFAGQRPPEPAEHRRPRPVELARDRGEVGTHIGQYAGAT
jgi:hypothetical protein